MASGRNASASRTSIRSLTSPSTAGTSVETTSPVIVRVPSGTSTRAPLTGLSAFAGTRYVSSGSVGTGTATETNIRGAANLQSSICNLQFLDDHLHVFPHLTFCGRVPQQIGRVEGRHDGNAVERMELPSQTGDRRLGLQQRLRRELAQRDDHRRADGSDLGVQEGRTGFDLVRLRVSIARVAGTSRHWRCRPARVRAPSP